MLAAAPAIAGLVQGLTEDQRSAARASLGDLLRAEYGAGIARLPVATHVGIGVK
jgi:hypothetical protein